MQPRIYALFLADYGPSATRREAAPAGRARLRTPQRLGAELDRSQRYPPSVARVEPALVELCRVRMAQILGSEFDRSLRYARALADGLTEAKIAALPTYTRSPLFDERERLAIGFAELFAIQSSSIGDA